MSEFIDRKNALLKRVNPVIKRLLETHERLVKLDYQQTCPSVTELETAAKNFNDTLEIIAAETMP